MSNENDTTLTKVCTKCGRTLPTMSEYFRPQKTGRLGFRADCRECESIRQQKYNKEHYQGTKEYRAQYIREYYQKNKERLRANIQGYQIENREKIRVQQRKRRQLIRESSPRPIKAKSTTRICTKCNVEHPSTTEFFYRTKRGYLYAYCKRCHNTITRQRASQWAKDNAEHIKESSRKKYQADSQYRDRVRDRGRRWRANNPEKVKVIMQRRLARERSLPDTLTAEQWQSCLDYFHHCCAYCGSQQDFWNVIEAEHYIPLSSHDCPGTVATNIVPSCRACNASKHKSDPVKWIIRKFGKRHGNQILRRIQDFFDVIIQ